VRRPRSWRIPTSASARIACQRTNAAPAWYGRSDILEWLLERGAPLEAHNTYGGTVLDGTCWGAANAPVPGVDYPAIVERLCRAGADLGAVGPFPTGVVAIDEVLDRYRGG